MCDFIASVPVVDSLDSYVLYTVVLYVGVATPPLRKLWAGFWCSVLTVIIVTSPRSLDYGSTFDNIESRLDTSDPNPVLASFFYVSDFNKNMVSVTLPRLLSLELLGLARETPCSLAACML